jgi:hypothetical protein
MRFAFQNAFRGGGLVMSPSHRADKTRSNCSTLIPPDIADLFGQPPLLATENRQAYDKLFRDLVLEWEPRKTTDWLLVHDLADLNWEILRFRHAIASVLRIASKEALAEIFTHVLPGPLRSRLPQGCEALSKLNSKAEALADAWFEGPEQQEKVKSTLAKYGLDAQAVVGQAFVLRCNELDKMQRMLTDTESRRDAILRSLHAARAMSSMRTNQLVETNRVPLLPVA